MALQLQNHIDLPIYIGTEVKSDDKTRFYNELSFNLTDVFDNDELTYNIRQDGRDTKNIVSINKREGFTVSFDGWDGTCTYHVNVRPYIKDDRLFVSIDAHDDVKILRSNLYWEQLHKYEKYED